MGQQDSGSKQRKPVKKYAIGDPVEVFSLSNQTWILDGEVGDIVNETCIRGKFKLRAGSVKVLFDNATRFKWVAPADLENHVRPSPRVKPPEALWATLKMEVHLETTQWQSVHVEVNRGFIQWWENVENAKEGKKSAGVAYLLGLQQFRDGLVLKWRADATQGAVYAFKVESESQAEQWIAAMWEHAGFTEEVRESFEAKQNSSHMRNELLGAVSQRKKPPQEKKDKRQKKVQIVGGPSTQPSEVKAGGA